MDESLVALTVVPRSGVEPFHIAGTNVGFDVSSFWRWAASDLTSNVWRGVLAEYLVARALGCETLVRTEWDACDIRTKEGLRVEVKSAAYLQSWHQQNLSAISFDVGLKRGWDARTNTYTPTPCRSADVYVFALLSHRDKATLDATDLSQWEFYVTSARVLDATYGSQKRIGLRSLLRIAPRSVLFPDLRTAVTAAGIPAPYV
jgi:hypothetical protein